MESVSIGFSTAGAEIREVARDCRGGENRSDWFTVLIRNFFTMGLAQEAINFGANLLCHVPKLCAPRSAVGVEGQHTGGKQGRLGMLRDDVARDARPKRDQNFKQMWFSAADLPSKQRG